MLPPGSGPLPSGVPIEFCLQNRVNRGRAALSARVGQPGAPNCHTRNVKALGLFCEKLCGQFKRLARFFLLWRDSLENSWLWRQRARLTFPHIFEVLRLRNRRKNPKFRRIWRRRHKPHREQQKARHIFCAGLFAIQTNRSVGRGGSSSSLSGVAAVSGGASVAADSAGLGAPSSAGRPVRGSMRSGRGTNFGLLCGSAS